MAKTTPSPIPTARFLPVGRAAPETAPHALAELAAKAWTAKRKAEIAQQAYEVVKNELKKALVPGDCLTLPGLCRVTLIPRETWNITNPERLERVLGAARYRDLVITQTVFKPTPKLIDLQDDPAEEHREAIAACLTTTVSSALDLREDKTV